MIQLHRAPSVWAWVDSLPPVPAAVAESGEIPPDLSWVYDYYDRDGHLLYVGISRDAAKRAAGHRANSPWWRFVAAGGARRVRADLVRRIERTAIRHLRPVFNVHSARFQARWEVIEYCAKREAWDLVDHLLATHDVDHLARSARIYGSRWPGTPTGTGVQRRWNSPLMWLPK